MAFVGHWPAALGSVVCWFQVCSSGLQLTTHVSIHSLETTSTAGLEERNSTDSKAELGVAMLTTSCVNQQSKDGFTTIWLIELLTAVTFAVLGLAVTCWVGTYGLKRTLIAAHRSNWLFEQEMQQTNGASKEQTGLNKRTHFLEVKLQEQTFRRPKRAETPSFNLKWKSDLEPSFV